jgi:hypothetical protein
VRAVLWYPVRRLKGRETENAPLRLATSENPILPRGSHMRTVRNFQIRVLPRFIRAPRRSDENPDSIRARPHLK